MKELTIVKIGGNIIDSPNALQDFLCQFSRVEGYKILVHGGGKIASEIGDRLGIASNYIDGRRITDPATLELVTMVYGGLVNKKIVAALQSEGCNAIGLCGADGNSMLAVRRPVGEINFGFVGDVRESGVNTGFILNCLQAALTLVFAPLTHDGRGQILNTNADTIAQEIAKAMSANFAVRLIYCFEKGGVLMDPNNDKSVIPTIDKKTSTKLVDQAAISAGMIPKLNNAFAAIDAGVKQVVIGNALDLAELVNAKKGTHIL